jgi:multiple sugar transport system substrate-binding protein
MNIFKTSIRLIPITLSTLLIAGSIRVTTAQEPVTLRVMTLEHELTPESIASFEVANPDIQIELVSSDSFALDLAVATGDMPDVLRVGADQVPQLVREDLLLDLTGFFEASDLIHLDDLANAADYYKFNNRYYGLPKDWSPDFSLHVYETAFEAAGVPIPGTTEPMTYAELAELAQKLTIRDGNTVIQYGFYSAGLDQVIKSILVQRGTSMFNEDFTEMQLTDNPAAMEVVKFFYDMALNGSMYPIPRDTSEDGGVIMQWQGKIPMFQYGYWFGASVDSDLPIYDHLVMLPAPTWDRSLPRLNATAGPVGMVISSSTQHPAEAYRFFEWYIAGQAAVARASTGWGAPALLSLFDLLPHESEFDRQRLSVLKSELPYSDWVLPVYPYRNLSSTFNQSWGRNIQKAIAGDIDFETFANTLQDEINLAIISEQGSETEIGN